MHSLCLATLLLCHPLISLHPLHVVLLQQYHLLQHCLCRCTCTIAGVSAC